MRILLILVALVALTLSDLALAQGALAQSSTIPPLPRPRPATIATQPQTSAPADQTRTGDNADNPGPEVPDLNAVTNNGLVPVVSGPPQPVTLTAKISESGPVIPDGLTWRVFGASATDAEDTSGLPLIAKSTDPTAVFDLPPGEYLVHLAYGKAQTTQTVSVRDQALAKTLVLDAGALRLHAEITGDVPINSNRLRFDIYPDGYEDTGRPAIATNVAPNQIVRLGAGVYHVVSHYGKINAVVHADLRVEPGQLTDATLFHDAARINLKLVSEEGGEAIADVDWTVKNAKGKTVYTHFGAFPTAVLAKGDYTALAKQGSHVYNRDFSVVPGPAQTIEVLTKVYDK